MGRRPTQPSTHLLLVEGPNDKHVVRHLWRRIHGDCPHFQISAREGFSKVLDAISVEARVSGRQVLGIMVDADSDPVDQWRSIIDQLQTLGIKTLTAPRPDGTIIDATDNMPRIGVWLMPDNQSCGELEDFVRKMIPDNDPVWPLSQGYIDDIPEGDRKFTQGKVLRAKIYAWLAARKAPRYMGLAMKESDLEIDGALCTRFTGWLERLFV